MEYISSENLHNGGDDGGDDPLSGRCTATPQRQRRPLQQLNYPVVASPRPNVTPYKYHRCRVIPEETENEENINPSMKQAKNSGFRSRMKSNASSSEDTKKDESSPFVYPLIWETHQVVTSSPSMVSQSDPVESGCGLGIRGQGGSVEKSKFPREDMGENLASLEAKLDRGSALEENAKRGAAASGEKGNCKSTPSTSTSCSSSKISHGNVSSLSHFGPMVTPSKSTPTPPPSDRPIFLTPSERFKKTGDCRGVMTPQRRKPNHQVNPFEVAAECLHLPAVSPSLFRQVVSPSQKVDSNFHWSIDQLAVLHPANIETSPYNQADIQHDPDYERQAQDAIDRFFNHHSVVPSPWTGSQKSVNLLQMVCTPVHPVSSQPTPRTNTVWCQTELSIPPVLPEAVEEALKPFCTFTQDQFWQGGCEDEGTSLNNTTLRRKLLFSQDELLNATPMCSPRGADTPDPDSRPPSPTVPLPLDDEDEVPIISEEEDDHRNLLWCGTIINRGEIGTSSKDPQLARHPPPTPPSCMSYLPSDKLFSEPFAFRRPDKNERDSPMIQCSPNLSPVQAQQSNEGPVLVTSPDVSPIHCHQYISIPSPRDVFISASSHISEDTSFHDPVLGQPLSSFRVSSSQDHAVSCTETSAKDSPSCSLPFHTALYSDSVLHNEEMLPVSPRSGCLQSSYFTMRLQQSLEFSVKCHDSCSKDKSCENIHECVTGSNLSSETSHGGAIERQIDKENCGDCLRTTPKIKKIPSPCRILNNIPCNETSSEINCEAPEQDQIWKQESKEKKENLIKESDENQQKTPVKTAVEQRSSSGHFSSSPIREDGNSPLAMDTPRKRFSSSPPLSPILCRSLMFLPHQENHHLRSQPKSHFSLSQSTHMSIDIDGKSCIEEEIMIDDERLGLTSSTRHVSQSLQQPRTTTTLRRASSVCDMETDSLEVNVSGEVPSQDTGYATGSLHSTNFSMSTFGNENGTTSSQTHLKDCHVNSLANTTGLSVDPYTSKVVCSTEGGSVWKGNL